MLFLDEFPFYLLSYMISLLQGLPEVLHPLGSLVCQESFSVLTENKTGSHIFRNKQQVRHLLLYDNQLIFCKQFSEKAGVGYQFKFSLAIANLGMSSVVKGDDKKLEIWILGQSDVYSLGAKTRKAKEDFAVELRNVIIKQKERNANRPVRISQSIVYNEQMSTTSGVSSESLRWVALEMIIIVKSGGDPTNIHTCEKYRL